jgi:hypothetical protein
MELPTQKKQARQQTSWQPYGWIFTDPNGTASDDATPFRAHKTYILSDALSWISLIGSMSRPRTNNRSTNFWAWFGQCLEKLGDMGSAMAPREAYGVDADGFGEERKTELKFDSIKNLEYLYNLQRVCYDTLYLKTSIKNFNKSKGIKISKEEWEKLEKLW